MQYLIDTKKDRLYKFFEQAEDFFLGHPLNNQSSERYGMLLL